MIKAGTTPDQLPIRSTPIAPSIVDMSPGDERLLKKLADQDARLAFVRAALANRVLGEGHSAPVSAAYESRITSDSSDGPDHDTA